MKIDGDGTPVMAPYYIGYKSYNVSTTDRRNIFVVIPKKTLKNLQKN